MLTETAPGDDIYGSVVEHGLLSALSEDERRAVLKTMVRRTYRKGDTLFHEGEPGNLLYVIEHGRVAIRVSTALGDVATLTVLGPGDSFGEQALLDEMAMRTASAVALEPVEVRTLQRQHFDEGRHYASVDRLLVEVLAAQVRRLSAHLLEALYLPPTGRWCAGWPTSPSSSRRPTGRSRSRCARTISRRWPVPPVRRPDPRT